MNALWRRWRERWRALRRPDWEPTTGQMRAIEADLAERPWPPPAPAEPAWTGEALLRSLAPHLYTSFDAYWSGVWRDWFSWQFRQDLERIRHRAECGLPPLQCPTLPIARVAWVTA